MARIWLAHKVLSISRPDSWDDAQVQRAEEHIESMIEQFRHDLEVDLQMKIGGDLRVKVRD